jgi:hypothetical protein
MPAWLAFWFCRLLVGVRNCKGQDKCFLFGLAGCWLVVGIAKAQDAWLFFGLAGC